MFKYGHKFLLYVIIIFFLLTTTIIHWSHRSFVYPKEFNNFDNVTGHYRKIIPNIIHYITFGKRSFDFSTYLSILSSVKYQNPSVLYIHSDNLNFNGDNWDKILRINNTTPIITTNYMVQPTHVFGQPISSIYHATDVARILVLQQWGGIYLDTDVLILKCLDRFRHFEMAIGWPENEYIGTQILLAHKNARFLIAWLNGYRRYIPRNWYYNAGQYPTEQILEKMPQLVHRVPDLFGVHNLLSELYATNNWTDWRHYYALHLLSRHKPAPLYLNETLIEQMNSTFKQIAKYVLNS